MTRNEVIELLGVISLVDDRVVKTDEDEQRWQVELWATALRDVPYAFATQAIGEHYAASAYPIMPKDVAERWRRERRNRIERHVELHVNDDLPHDDDVAYRQALAERRQAVISGQQQAALPPARGITSRSQFVPANDTFRTALAELRRWNREGARHVDAAAENVDEAGQVAS